MNENPIYFCLNDDGLLYNLGCQGNIDDAEAEAEAKRLNPIWMFDDTEAANWVDFLVQELNK